MNDPDHVDSAVSFGRKLAALRAERGLTVRQLAGELNRAHSGLVAFERGQRLPRADVVVQYEEFFGLPTGQLGALRERVRLRELELPRDGTDRRTIDDGVCPYKGLYAFGSEDAELFFGRDQEIKAGLQRLAEVRFVAVVGASGVGKSSFVRAGLIAGIRARVDGGMGVHVALLTPGRDPLAQLAHAVNGDGDAGVVADELRTDPGRVLTRARESFGERLVIVVDQLEELFTSCDDEAERRCFVEALLAAWRDPTSLVSVVVALRADFYGSVTAYPELAAAVVAHQTLIGPMDRDNLRLAIERPAAGSRLILQRGLAETMLDDIADEPGALPLLSHALRETWMRRQPLMLTVGGYREAGGVRDAISRTADSTLEVMAEPDRAIARSVFLSLTGIGESSESTRRRVDREELSARVQPAASLDRVLGILADARLITIDGSTVTIAHEALIRHWPTLRGWIETDRAVLLDHRRLAAAAREWDGLGREPAALYRGARLAAAGELETHDATRLSRLERDFLSASQAAERDAGELESRRRRRLRALATGLAALSAIVATLAVWALAERGQAQRQLTDSNSLGLALTATSLLATRPDVSLLLAYAAYRESPRVEARSSLIAALGAVRQPRLVGILHGHADTVRSVAFSPDGRTMASASDDDTIRLWDVRTHKQIGAPLTGHTYYVYGVAFSPDGQELASASFDSTIRLWSVRTHKQIGRPMTSRSKYHDWVSSIAFSPDGRTLVTGSFDGTVRLWSVSADRQIGTSLRGHGALVTSVAFSPDGRTVASGSFDDTVRLWNVATQKESGSPLRGHTGGVYSVAFSRDGRTLASASLDKTIRIWTVATGRELGRPLRGDTDRVESVAFSPDGRTLASGSDDKTVRLWDVARQTEIGDPMKGHTAGVRSVAFSPDGRSLASAGFDSTIRLWDLGSGAPPTQPLTGFADSVETVVFSPDGATLATESYDDQLRLWDTRTHRSVPWPLSRRVPPPVDPLFQELQNEAASGFTGITVAFGRDDRTLAYLGPDGVIELRDPRTGTALGQPLVAGLGVTANTLAISPDGRTLASGSDDKAIRLWNLSTHAQIGRPFAQDAGPFGGLAFSPDGRMLASASSEAGIVRLWDVRTHKMIGRPLTGHNDAVNSVVFSPDGRTLASASFDKTVRLWDVATQKELGQPLTGHTGPVNSVAFSPDGRTLASAGADKTVRLWDVATHEPLGTPLVGHTGAIHSVTFSPDGRSLASGSDDKTARLWPNVLWHDDRELQTWVCDLVGSDLTPTEWAQYAPGIRYAVGGCGEGPGTVSGQTAIATASPGAATSASSSTRVADCTQIDKLITDYGAAPTNSPTAFLLTLKLHVAIGYEAIRMKRAPIVVPQRLLAASDAWFALGSAIASRKAATIVQAGVAVRQANVLMKTVCA